MWAHGPPGAAVVPSVLGPVLGSVLGRRSWAGPVAAGGMLDRPAC